MKHEIVSRIPLGSKNAKDRFALAEEFGVSDRVMRQMIEDARRDGILICNDNDGRGYYIAESIDEIERQYNRDKARALSVLARQKTMRRLLKAAGRSV